MHIIIGKGNLGVDLKIALMAAGQKSVIYTKSSGFTWRNCREEILRFEPTHIWITAGFGSVEACEKDLVGAVETHVNLPLEIARDAPETVRVGIFSTDYAASESHPGNPNHRVQRPRSFYALTKMWMEDATALLSRGNMSVFRVCSLYGEFYPEKTFPGKIAIYRPDALPTNIVVPTPTWWIAQTLVHYLDGHNTLFSPTAKYIHHVAPQGPGIRISDWGRLVLGRAGIVRDLPADKKRPLSSNLGCSLPGQAPTWQELWNQHLLRCPDLGKRRGADPSAPA